MLTRVRSSGSRHRTVPSRTPPGVIAPLAPAAPRGPSLRPAAGWPWGKVRTEGARGAIRRWHCPSWSDWSVRVPDGNGRRSVTGKSMEMRQASGQCQLFRAIESPNACTSVGRCRLCGTARRSVTALINSPRGRSGPAGRARPRSHRRSGPGNSRILLKIPGTWLVDGQSRH